MWIGAKIHAEQARITSLNVTSVFLSESRPSPFPVPYILEEVFLVQIALPTGKSPYGQSIFPPVCSMLATFDSVYGAVCGKSIGRQTWHHQR
jgi:hypothetical protein